MAGTIKKISVDKIQNYFENPRHEIATNERETLKKLFESVGVQYMVNLAEDIYKNGLMGGQQVTVVYNEEIKKYIVYEGNRRIAAIKLLSNPDQFDFLDKATIDRIKRITKDGKKIGSVDCYITDESDALFIMERRHSGEDKGRGVKPWSPREKEAFFNRQNDKKSISYLIDVYVKRYFDGYDITTIMPFTTLQRVFGNKSVRVSIGLDISDEDTFTAERMQLVVDAAKWIAQEAQQAGVSITRLFNKAKATEEKLVPWIINYQAEKRNVQVEPTNALPSQNLETNATDILQDGSDLENEQNSGMPIVNHPPQTPAADDNQAKPLPNNTAAPAAPSIIPPISTGSTKNLPYFFQGINYSHLDPNDADTHGVAAVCNELKLFGDKRLVQTFPLSATFLTRSIIEHALVFYSKKHNIQGQSKLIWENIKSQTKLSKIIGDYKKNLANYITDPIMRQYFTDLFDNYETNVDPLNWVVHRPSEYQLDAQTLIDLPRKGLLALINFLISP